MRAALDGLQRFIATPNLTKHRLFVWLDARVLPDHQLIAIARDDDYTFGVLHSRVHELWALRMGTQLETRPRYTPTTTFETFPFPHPTDDQREAIAAAARRLNDLREGWFNPLAATDEELERRTLTNLYNEMPAWLRDARAVLDGAVFHAYGLPADSSDEDVRARLLALNLQRADGYPLVGHSAARRPGGGPCLRRFRHDGWLLRGRGTEKGTTPAAPLHCPKMPTATSGTAPCIDARSIASGRHAHDGRGVYKSKAWLLFDPPATVAA